MAKSLRWEYEPVKTWTAGFAKYQGDVVAELQAIALYFAPQVESWLREHAPWTDRTGLARISLHADVENLVNGAALIMAHGVEYGIFLEMSNHGVWGVLPSALDYWGPIIWAEVKRRFSK